MVGFMEYSVKTQPSNSVEKAMLKMNPEAMPDETLAKIRGAVASFFNKSVFSEGAEFAYKRYES